MGNEPEPMSVETSRIRNSTLQTRTAAPAAPARARRRTCHTEVGRIAVGKREAEQATSGELVLGGGGCFLIRVSRLVTTNEGRLTRLLPSFLVS